MRLERRDLEPPEKIKNLVKGDLYNKFKEDNGIRDQIEADSDFGRQIVYKLRLGLGLNSNP